MASQLPLDLTAKLERAANAERAIMQAKICNAEPGGYGEGDVFLGVTVPVQRALAKQYWQLPLEPLAALLRSPIHEHRLTGLLILGERYARDPESQVQTFEFALENRSAANNWDLTDTLGPDVFGAHVATRSRKLLYEFARSKSLWDRRLALVSTLPLIRARQYADTLALAEKLLDDEHDLIHKATGWMLREVGKKDPTVLRAFLRAHSHRMPRTALRYAIEHFSDTERKQWLLASKAALKANTALTAKHAGSPRMHGALLQRVARR